MCPRPSRGITKIIHLTEVLKGSEKALTTQSSGTMYGQKIETANLFCRTVENGAALAGIAITEIRKYREEQYKRSGGRKGKAPPAIPKQAYIIRQLKRSDEIKLLRSLYGNKFLQISVSLEKDARVQNLVTKLSRDHPHLKQHECEAESRRLIEVDEHEEGDDFGQQVGDIFHLGDFFVHAGDKTKLAAKSLHFIRALFGDNAKSPNPDEFGAFMAASASLRTVDLSRQVGAAITTKSGDVVSIGCNEVPKAGGGNYWIHDDPIDRDIERGTEQNGIEKQRIIVDFLKQLSQVGFVTLQENLDSPEMKEKLNAAVDDALISDITEYGRMTHAEMTAICDAARLGRSLQGTTIFVTTFPCHNCAKHIVASGIDRVVYIEPYPKSKATSSHTDAISIDGVYNGKVAYEHFEGIAATRYRDIFRKGKRRKGNTVLEWYEGEPRPRITQRDNLHVDREDVAAFSALKKLYEQRDGEAEQNASKK